MSEHFPPFAATFIIATLHSLLPSHWLCFVVIGRARQWSLRRVLATTAAAGTLHAVTTFALGIGLLVMRVKAAERLEGYVESVAASILVICGAIYLILHATGKGHHHAHDERLAIGTLLVSMTISPCVPAIVIFLGVAEPSALVVGLLGVLLLAATVGVMLALVSISYVGAEAARLKFAGRYEKLVIGLTLVALGAVTYGVHLLEA